MKAIALLFAALLFVGCGSKPSAPKTATPASGDVSFAKDIQPVLTQTCMPCHAGGPAAKGKYDVTGYAGVMGDGSGSAPDVIPGKADSSSLYLRLTGAVPPLMPKGRPALDSAHLGTIRKWIDQGAKNN
ncbi:MAG TPA: c-type cytochrome domain-containing protein [bacterium]|nr:c-type cytochrome domain-containing protein [bacterium]